MTPPADIRVLYAEDDENDVFFMERAFSRLRLRPALRVVLNGREAVDYLAGRGVHADRQKHPLPTALLLDVKMPEMSGLEVLQWARARPEFATLPIVLFTSSTQRSDIEFSRMHGANAYLVKPSNAEHLAQFVGQLVEICARPLARPDDILPLAGNQLTGSSEPTPSAA